jgi:hypothetical protein
MKSNCYRYKSTYGNLTVQWQVYVVSCKKERKCQKWQIGKTIFYDYKIYISSVVMVGIS